MTKLLNNQMPDQMSRISGLLHPTTLLDLLVWTTIKDNENNHKITKRTSETDYTIEWQIYQTTCNLSSGDENMDFLCLTISYC